MEFVELKNVDHRIRIGRMAFVELEQQSLCFAELLEQNEQIDQAEKQMIQRLIVIRTGGQFL